MFIPKLNHNHTISIFKFSFIHPSSSLLTHCLLSPLQNPNPLLPSSPSMAQPPLSAAAEMGSAIHSKQSPTPSRQSLLPPASFFAATTDVAVVLSPPATSQPHSTSLTIQNLILLSSPPYLPVTFCLPSTLPRSRKRESIGGAFRRLSDLHLVITISLINS